MKFALKLIATVALATTVCGDEGTDVNVALAADDECVKGDEECSLEALQLRASRAKAAAPEPSAEADLGAAPQGAAEEADLGAAPPQPATEGATEPDAAPPTGESLKAEAPEDAAPEAQDSDSAEEQGVEKGAEGEFGPVDGEKKYKADDWYDEEEAKHIAGKNQTEDWQVVNDLPEGWNTSESEESLATTIDDIGDAAASAAAAVVAKAVGEAAEGGSLKPMYDHYVAVNCKYNPGAKQCVLYRRCRGPAYCIMGGYMVVPGFYAAGMESINGGNAGRFDYLFSAAKRHCSDTHCVLLTNPVGFRTQNQLHIHFRHYNGGGSHLKGQLERSLCKRDPGHWHHFWKCGSAKAAIFDDFPGVFSVVDEAYHGMNLANVGIAVFFTTACGGFKTIILATTYCSIEHSVTNSIKKR